MLYCEFTARCAVSVDGETYDQIEPCYYGFHGNKEQFIDIINALSVDPVLLDEFLLTCAYSDDEHYDRSYYTLTAVDSDKGFNVIYKRQFAFRITALLMAEKLTDESLFSFTVDGINVF